ncbi:MAG: aldo/keto reductase [Candidatus Sumerlaeaceae bacterium]
MSVKLRPLGATGIQVSEIGFGALEIGRDWAADVNENSRHLTQAEASRVLNGLLDLGVNFIDTAPAYWYSEEFIGKALANRRSEYVLATKVGEHCDPDGSVYDYSYDATLRFVEESLRRLCTDTIDLLQIHSASIEILERGETFAAMQEAQRAGKVRHLGMTGGVAECVRALEIGGYETVQFPYNLLNLSAEDRLLDLAREKNAGVIIMRGLAGGKLSRKYMNLQNAELRGAIAGFEHFASGDKRDPLVHLALGYVLARPEVSSVIAGSRRLEAVEENIAAANRPLQSEQVERVRQYARSVVANTW